MTTHSTQVIVIWYSNSNHRHVGHAFWTRFGGESLCGKARARFDDKLKARRPGRLCTRCAKLVG